MHLGLGSALAYQAKTDIQKTLEPQGFRVHWFSQESGFLDVQCYLAQTDAYQVLAFRGTEVDKLADWLKNLDVRKAAWIAGKAHRGFQNEWEAVRLGIQQTACPFTPLLVTGHSKGAAVATLAAAELAVSNFNVAGLYTFGSPRILDRKAAAWFTSLPISLRTWRMFHSNDIVPRVPTALRFRHVGTPVYLRELRSEWGERKVQTWLESPGFWQLVHYQWTSYFFDALEDHEMINYIRCLRASA